MGVSEPQRLALHAAARRALGDEEGDTLMALSPPANTDMATMQALDRTEAKLGARIDQLDIKIDTVAALLVGQIERSELRTRLWGLAALITTQLAVVTYLTNALG